MKRYKKLSTTMPNLKYCGFGVLEVENKMIKDPEGEWVKYGDVEEKIDEAYKAGYFTGQNSNPAEDVNEMISKAYADGWDRKPHAAFIDSHNKQEIAVCNCEEKLNERRVNMPWHPANLDWICPVHGYVKR